MNYARTLVTLALVGVSREMNGKFFVYKKFEIVKYI